MEPPIRTLEGARVDELMRLACEQKSSVDILLWEVAEGISTRGVLLRVAEDDRGRYVLAEVACRDGLDKKTVEGTRLEAVFQLRGERYAFPSLLMGCGVGNAKDGIVRHVLVLKYPQILENRQRRANYRVQLDAALPVTVAFHEAGLAGPFRQGTWYSGLLHDISGGGVALLTYQTLDASIDQDTRLEMWFQLPDSSDQISVEGIIRNRRAREPEEDGPPGGLILGIEFAQDGTDPQRLHQLDAIRRFVVARQRDILKRLRLM